MTRQFYMWILLFCSATITLKGQQNPTFTEYNYNPFIINSGYTGITGDAELTLSNNGFGNQDFQGSPRTFAMTFNTSLRNDRMGLGAGVVNDEIGVTSATQVFGTYSYRIILNENAHPYWKIYDRTFISFGIRAGALMYRQDLLGLGIQDDPNFSENIDTTLPMAGMGILFGHANFFAGLSLPNVIGDQFYNGDNLKLSRPVYGYTGYHFMLDRYTYDYILKPSLLFKYESGAPFQLDANLALRMKNTIELGAGYRTNSSFNVFAGLYFLENFRAVYSYTHGGGDSPLRNVHGLLISYRFGKGFSLDK